MNIREDFERWAEINIGWRDMELKRCIDDPECYVLDLTQHAWMAWKASKELPDGWHIVPINFDSNMIDAALKEESEANRRGEPASFTDLWEAILNAAPSPSGE